MIAINAFIRFDGFEHLLVLFTKQCAHRLQMVVHIVSPYITVWTLNAFTVPKRLL